VTRLKNSISIVVAAVALAVVVAVSMINWNVLGDTGIDLNGWIALMLDVLATLAVGVGLMALIFISNRRGYDKPPETNR